MLGSSGPVTGRAHAGRQLAAPGTAGAGLSSNPGALSSNLAGLTSNLPSRDARPRHAPVRCVAANPNL